VTVQQNITRQQNCIAAQSTCLCMQQRSQATLLIAVCLSAGLSAV